MAEHIKTSGDAPQRNSERERESFHQWHKASGEFNWDAWLRRDGIAGCISALLHHRRRQRYAKWCVEYVIIFTLLTKPLATASPKDVFASFEHIADRRVGRALSVNRNSAHFLRISV